jgi:hypothetical protein
MAFFKNTLVSVALIAFAAGSVSASPVDTAKSGVLLPRNGCYSGGESFVDAGFPAGDTTCKCEVLGAKLPLLAIIWELRHMSAPEKFPTFTLNLLPIIFKEVILTPRS